MAITITKLKMWKNPGYTERCSDVPPPGSWKLPNPDYTSSTNLRPRKDGTITSIELPLSFCQVFDMSYLYMEATDGRSPANTIKVFGWIHSVEVTASSEDAVKIDWTPDWWRTYAGSVTWGSGVVKRCSDSSHRRPSVFTPRIKRASLHQIITPTGNDESMFCVIKATYTYGGTPTKTSIRTYVFPLAEGVYTRTGGTDTLHGIAPGMSQISAGYVDECLGLDADTIQGAWIFPFNAFNNMYKISGGYSGSSSTWNAITNTFNGITWACFYAEGDPINPLMNLSFSAITSDDLTVYGVADQRGNLISVLPWGITVSRVHIGINLGTINASLVLKFDNGGSGTGHQCAFSDGLGVSIPLPSVPIGSNAYSSYVYSGQRDYEMAVNETTQRMNYEKGTVSALGGAVSGGLGGAIAGKGVGALIGASGGLALSMGQQIWLNDIETRYRDSFQAFEDMKYSMQASNILIPGEGNDWNNVNISPRYHYIVKLDADSVSASEYSSMISKNGYECNFMATGSEISALMGDGKPLQIEQLQLTGSIPPQAKNTIKTMLESGIRIKEYNPSGVLP